MEAKNNRPIPVPGELYRHFKGKLYQIVAIAIHSETEQQLVIYQALYGDYQVYARPLDLFLSPVDHKKYPNIKEFYRFTKLVQKTGTGDEQTTTDDRKNVTEAESNCDVGIAHNETHLPTDTSEELFLLFLDKESSKEKLEVLGSLRPHMTRRIADGIAASLDLVLSGKSMDEDIALIEDHLRTRARFELRH